MTKKIAKLAKCLIWPATFLSEK